MRRAPVPARARRPPHPHPRARAPRPTRSSRVRPANTRRRLGIATIVVVLVFAALGVRVIQLQIVSGDRYRDMALGQRLRTIPLVAERGSIFDRNGRDLAISVERSSVFADPQVVTDAAMYASRLSSVVGVDQQTLFERLSDRKRRFVYIARTVDDTVAEQVRALGLAGVGFVPEPERQYPAGDLASVIIGQVGSEGTGLDGLELYYEDLLAGRTGEVVVERDQQGRDIPDTERRKTEARPGADLVLTIDQPLQYQLEYSLADQVTATNAKRGVGIVVDVRTGDVLAMATVDGPSAEDPTARPARAGERNGPMQDTYEPGSTNKVVPIAAAIELGRIGPDTPFEVPMTYEFGGKTYRDSEQHEPMQWSTADILRESSNVGAIKVAETLSVDELDRAMRDFGFGSETTIDFPGEEAGVLKPPGEYYSTGLASIAIGYNLAVTPMQMLDVFTTLANGGETRNPRLLDTVIDAEGARRRVETVPGRRVVSKATADVMTQMLSGVVRGGTGVCASVPGYVVAGKTGTANKSVGGGYAENATMASFAGYAPANDPRIAAIVVIDEPQTQYGSRAAAPVFSEVMQSALWRYRVAPTDNGADPQFDAARALAADEGNDCAVPHGAALESVLAQRQAAALAAATSTTTTTTIAPTTETAASTQAAETATGTVTPDTIPIE